MKITARCDLLIRGRSTHALTPEMLRIMRDDLTASLSISVDELVKSYGITNLTPFAIQLSDLTLDPAP